MRYICQYMFMSSLFMSVYLYVCNVMGLFVSVRVISRRSVNLNICSLNLLGRPKLNYCTLHTYPCQKLTASLLDETVVGCQWPQKKIMTNYHIDMFPARESNPDWQRAQLARYRLIQPNDLMFVYVSVY